MTCSVTSPTKIAIKVTYLWPTRKLNHFLIRKPYSHPCNQYPPLLVSLQTYPIKQPFETPVGLHVKCNLAKVKLVSYTAVLRDATKNGCVGDQGKYKLCS